MGTQLTPETLVANREIVGPWVEYGTIETDTAYRIEVNQGRRLTIFFYLEDIERSVVEVRYEDLSLELSGTFQQVTTVEQLAEIFRIFVQKEEK